MTIELTPNEAAWIIDKAAKTCAHGEFTISQLTEEQLEKDELTKEAVREARKIIEAVAKLGLKLANALEKELDSKE